MVDFNAGETVTTPATDIVRVLLLQRRNDVIDAFEEYYKNLSIGVMKGSNIVRARLRSLWLEMQAALKRRLKKEEYERLRGLLEEKDIERLEELFYTLNEELDAWKLTRLDTQKQYDSTRVEIENKAKNL